MLSINYVIHYLYAVYAGMNQQNRAKVVNTNSQVVPKTKAIMAEVDEYSVFDLMAIMSPASDTTMFRKSRSTYAIIILKCK